jgi:hypothetical protein
MECVWRSLTLVRGRLRVLELLMQLLNFLLGRERAEVIAGARVHQG